ncbi:yeats family-domain-containing protein [Chytriomyces sp. MP71]|nr:yeats family-domain-containing protein [Chytriomyces sp. MP71]KAI8619930.1 yeats family-domain-containing protein [Chytriomyces sp. MP71]
MQENPSSAEQDQDQAEQRVVHVLKTHFDVEILLRQKERAEIRNQLKLCEALRDQMLQIATTLDRPSDAPRSTGLMKAPFSAHSKPPVSDNLKLEAVDRDGREASVSDGADVIRNSNGQRVRLVCPVMSCRKSDFASAHGFLSHVRNSHHVKFGSYKEAIERCGIPFDEAIPERKPSIDGTGHLPVLENDPGDVEGALIVERDDGVMVRVACPNCRRSNFVSVHGFISHCRNMHKVRFPSYLLAVRVCGIVLTCDLLTRLKYRKHLTYSLWSCVSRKLTGIKSLNLDELDITKDDTEESGWRKKPRLRVLDVSTSDSTKVLAEFKMENFEDGVVEEGILSDEKSGSRSNNRELKPDLMQSLMPNLSQSETRFLIKKRVVVGNISRFIPEERRKLPKYEYKWMVYVQGPPSDPDITPFITRVRFHLHPDYAPNDIIDVHNPPFSITRYGWGEFPLRVRLYFADPARKRRA